MVRSLQLRALPLRAVSTGPSLILLLLRFQLKNV